jgi:hypothetical protein
MKWAVLLLALAAAACDASPCEDAVLLTPCPDCGAGEVKGGLVTSGTVAGRAVVRPGGGIARVGCETHLVRHDAAFEVDGDVGLYVQGAPALQGVTADDVALVVDRVADTGADLVAVARSGTELWRFSTTADQVWLTAAGDAVVAYGTSEQPVGFGELTVQGLFAVGLGAGDGQPRWAWSSPQGADATITGVGAADGSVVIGGIFAGELALGGTTTPLSAGASAGYIGKLDASGGGVWARQLVGPAASEVRWLDRAPDGSVALAGDYSGGTLDLDTVVLHSEAALSDQFVAVLEADGTPRWGMNLGDGTSERIQAIAATDAAVVVGGWHADDALSFGGDTIADEFDAYIASLADGTVTWLVQIGGAGNQSIAGLGWNGALHASVTQYASDAGPAAALDFHDLALDGDGALHLELAP